MLKIFLSLSHKHGEAEIFHIFINIVKDNVFYKRYSIFAVVQFYSNLVVYIDSDKIEL